jgi:hypothetical protein
MSFSRSEPYNHLPLLPPAADLETKAILRQTIASARALSDLKGTATKIPNYSPSESWTGMYYINDDLLGALSGRHP